MRLPLIKRKTYERDMRYAEQVIDALKKRYARAEFRRAMLHVENQSLRREMDDLRAKLETKQ